MIAIIAGFNIALGVEAAALVVLVCAHLIMRLRFTERQETTAIMLVGIWFFFYAVNAIVSGMLTNPTNFRIIIDSGFPWAYVVLAAKVGMNVMFLWLIYWVVFVFYPVAERRKD